MLINTNKRETTVFHMVCRVCDPCTLYAVTAVCVCVCARAPCIRVCVRRVPVCAVCVHAVYPYSCSVCAVPCENKPNIAPSGTGIWGTSSATAADCQPQISEGTPGVYFIQLISAASKQNNIITLSPEVGTVASNCICPVKKLHLYFFHHDFRVTWKCYRIVFRKI